MRGASQVWHGFPPLQPFHTDALTTAGSRVNGVSAGDLEGNDPSQFATAWNDGGLDGVVTPSRSKPWHTEPVPLGPRPLPGGATRS